MNDEYIARGGQMRGWIAALLVIFVLDAEARAEDTPVRFEIQSEFGKSSDWVRPYLEKASRALVKLLAETGVAQPEVIEVRLQKDPSVRGIGGYAGPGRIGFKSHAWPKDRDRLWILAHELTNTFAHHYAGGGGYPSDWWSNGRSPFPEYVSCLVMKAAGHADAARWRRGVGKGKPDHVLFWDLHEEHGFSLFARFFRLLRDDGVDLGAIGAVWPAPDRIRSAYAIAYLSEAAGTNLAPLFAKHGVGRQPADWRQRHPEIHFVEYEVTAEDVETVLEARQWLFREGVAADRFPGMRHAFRRGGALGPKVVARAAESSRIGFEVTTQFGDESAWTGAHLDRSAELLVRWLGAADLSPPRKIVVVLSKDANFGGIGGGPGGGALKYTSNVWPKEPFRQWILVRDLARLLLEHYGGSGQPSDWWAPNATYFADSMAVPALTKLGDERVAGWLNRMHAGSRSHALFAKLIDAFDPAIFGRYVLALRKDGVDLRRIGAAWPAVDTRRSVYAAAYLSIAAGKSVVPHLKEYGVGTKPDGWDGQNPGKTFPAYGITEDAVENLIARRNRLFEKKASARARDRFRKGE